MNNELATNNDAEQNEIVHELNRRTKVDRPTFARVKYLVITESTITALFAKVFVMRH